MGKAQVLEPFVSACGLEQLGSVSCTEEGYTHTHTRPSPTAHVRTLICASFCSSFPPPAPRFLPHSHLHHSHPLSCFFPTPPCPVSPWLCSRDFTSGRFRATYGQPQTLEVRTCFLLLVKEGKAEEDPLASETCRDTSAAQSAVSGRVQVDLRALRAVGRSTSHGGLVWRPGYPGPGREAVQFGAVPGCQVGIISDSRLPQAGGCSLWSGGGDASLMGGGNSRLLN